jgi:hypothetical protein
MGFVFSVGNQGASGSQLQKRLLKHFNLPARDVVTAGRQFPISSRIDLQSLDSSTGEFRCRKEQIQNRQRQNFTTGYSKSLSRLRIDRLNGGRFR